MALAERGILRLPRIFPGLESGAKTTKIKPQLYSEKEISKMLIEQPPTELRDQNPVETPVGTWSMDGDLAVFDPKADAEVAKITKVSSRKKLTKIAKIVFQMS